MALTPRDIRLSVLECVVCGDFPPTSSFEQITMCHKSVDDHLELFAENRVSAVIGPPPTREAIQSMCTLTHVFDYEAVRTKWEEELRRKGDENSLSNVGMWRYWCFLPLSRSIDWNILPPLYKSIGNTPLIKLPLSAAKARKVREIYMKDDTRNPSASLKDRASAFVCYKALLNCYSVDDLEDKPIVIATASTGNAASSLSAMCGGSGGKLRAVVFAPASAPEPKIVQMLMYGAGVVLVKGNYDAAFELCSVCCKEFGWLSRSTSVNPDTAEGKKTAILEVCEQLSRYTSDDCFDTQSVFAAPDAVFVATGDGNTVSGIHRGLMDLLYLGYIRQMPRLYVCQSTGSNGITQAWSRHREALLKVKEAEVDGESVARSRYTVEADPSEGVRERIASHTIADSIAADVPRDAVRASRAVRLTGGKCITVTDQDILRAQADMARKYGLFVEPASAAAYAGFLSATESKKEASPLLRASDRVVIMLTGHGLKDPKSAAMGVGYVSPLPSSSPSSSSSSSSAGASEPQSVCVVEPCDVDGVREFAKKWDLL